MANQITVLDIQMFIDELVNRQCFDADLYINYFPMEDYWGIVLSVRCRFFNFIEKYIYSRNEINFIHNKLDLIKDIYKKIKDLDYQLRFYFEGIWG